MIVMLRSAIEMSVYGGGSLDGSARAAIVRCFWGDEVAEIGLDHYLPYFRHYEAEIRESHYGVAQSFHAAAAGACHDTGKICSIVDRLSSSGTKLRPDIRAALRDNLHLALDDVLLNRLIDQALRLWLTINVRERAFGDCRPDIPVVEWDDHSTLHAFVARQFPNPSGKQRTYHKPIGHDFTAVNIARLSSVTIRWTLCLADHLNYNDEHRELKVYPYKKCLLRHLSQSRPSIIPPTVLSETLLTLDLLFPHWDHRTERFLLREDQNFLQYGPFNDPHPIDFGDFSVWGSRLSRLDDVYHSPPVGWRQLWYDRRNPLQWYTFWLAALITLLTTVFGVISSVTSVIQARAALEAVRLASNPR